MYLLRPHRVLTNLMFSHIHIGGLLNLGHREMAQRCGLLLRKEVIQPQVPLRLPCYDFIPVTNHTLGAFLSLQSWISDFGCNQLP